jgi:hypothetical protein
MWPAPSLFVEVSGVPLAAAARQIFAMRRSSRHGLFPDAGDLVALGCRPAAKLLFD